MVCIYEKNLLYLFIIKKEKQFKKDKNMGKIIMYEEKERQETDERSLAIPEEIRYAAAWIVWNAS